MQQPARRLYIPPSDDNLAEIVEQARAGNVEAFSTLFSRYNARICTYLARMVGNDEDGRDLAQETFVRVWSTLPEIREPARFSSWLYRIATNLAVNYLNARKRRRWLIWAGSEQGSLPERPLYAVDATASVAEVEHVKQALANVKPKYRACLLLQIEGGFAQREIADLLHLSEKSISVYVQRGCEQFRQAYEHLTPEQFTSSERSVKL